jgi:hypothetical protein
LFLVLSFDQINFMPIAGGSKPISDVQQDLPMISPLIGKELDRTTASSPSSATTNVSASTNGWNGWTSLSGPIFSDPAVGRNADGRLEVFVKGGNNVMYHKSEISAGDSTTYSAWASLGGVG